MKMKQERESYLLLEEPRMYRAFMTLAYPVVLANLLKSLHDLVDTYFIGQMENSVAAQAGISVTWPLLNILLSFGMGLSIAGVAIVSQYLGSGQKERARASGGLLLVLSALIGLGVNLLVFVLAPGVLTLMGAKGGTYDAGLTYLRVRSFEMVFLLVFSAFQAIFQARGDTSTPVKLSVFSVAVNICLTAWFVRGLNWGIFGASLATLLGQAAAVPPCLWLLFRKKGDLYLRRQDLRIVKEDLRVMVRLALPSAASQAFSSLGFLVLQAVILHFGDAIAAAFSIGNKVSNLLLIPVSALSSILAAFVGQNVGAGNKERARRAYCTSRNIGIIFSILGAGVIFFFRRPLLSLLTNDGETLGYAMEYAVWVLLTQPLMALFQNYLGVFNGSGNTRYAFIVVSARLWLIRLPMILGFYLFTDLKQQGIWYAMVISNLLISVICALLFRRVDFEPKVRKAAEA